MRHLAKPLLALAIAACVSCATAHVSSYQSVGQDFTRYRTFEWGPADTLPASDVRLEGDPDFRDRLQGAVERGLAARALSRADRGAAPDLLVHYHVSVAPRLDVDRADYGYGYTVDVPAQLHQYEGGTLILDVVDARTRRVVWRGWARTDMTGLLRDPRKMADWLGTTVPQMLARFPGGF